MGKIVPVIEFREQLNWSDKTILLIENDFASTYLLTEWLNMTNAKFVIASNQDVLKLKLKLKVDLIIKGITAVELEMGLELIKKIKLKYAGVPIIGCSPCVFKNDIKDCCDAGCNEFLGKPVDLNMLTLIISTYF